MASKDLINIGLSPDSGTGDSARRGGEKINNLFADVYANLGDNPVITDTADSNYGTRQIFSDADFKVGELHAAGKYSLVEFTTPSSGLTSAGATGYTNTKIQTDSDWFFLSRGDQIGAIINSGTTINFVLPLAVVGDIVRVKDVNNTWVGKTVNVWTTPYEVFSANWVSKTFGAKSTGPDSDTVAITYTQRFSTTPTRRRAAYKMTTCSQSPSVAWHNDPVVLVHTSNQQYTELEFVYHGPKYGWHMTQKVGVDEFQHYVTELDSDLKWLNKTLDSESIQREARDAALDVKFTAATTTLQNEVDSEYRSRRLYTLALKSRLDLFENKILQMEDSDAQEIVDLWTKAADFTSKITTLYNKADSEDSRFATKIKTMDSDIQVLKVSSAASDGNMTALGNALEAMIDSDILKLKTVLKSSIDSDFSHFAQKDLLIHSRINQDSDRLTNTRLYDLFDIDKTSANPATLTEGEMLYWDATNEVWKATGTDFTYDNANQTIKANKITIGTWAISESGGKLMFNNGSNRVSIDASGNIIAGADVTAFGTP